MRNSKKSKTHVPLTFLIHYWIFVASLTLELLDFCNFKQNIFFSFSPFIFRTPSVFFKIMIIFNNTSADFVLISADVLSKMIIILKELRIANCVLKMNGLYNKY